MKVVLKVFGSALHSILLSWKIWLPLLFALEPQQPFFSEVDPLLSSHLCEVWYAWKESNIEIQGQLYEMAIAKWYTGKQIESSLFTFLVLQVRRGIW